MAAFLVETFFTAFVGVSDFPAAAGRAPIVDPAALRLSAVPDLVAAPPVFFFPNACSQFVEYFFVVPLCNTVICKRPHGEPGVAMTRYARI